jgi:PAS domain-containing protein
MSDRSAHHARARLQLVPATREDVRRHVWFCDACGAHAEAGVTPAPFDRRCRACDAGQLLEAAEPLAPTAGDAFLTFDDRLVVTSCSDAAAELLGTAAPAAVGQPLDALLSAPEAQGCGASLAPHLLTALADDGPPAELTARPAGVFGVRLRLRAGVCGPPRRGLAVLASDR